MYPNLSTTSLNVLSRHMHEQGFIFDASNERMALERNKSHESFR